ILLEEGETAPQGKPEDHIEHQAARLAGAERSAGRRRALDDAIAAAPRMLADAEVLELAGEHQVLLLRAIPRAVHLAGLDLPWGELLHPPSAVLQLALQLKAIGAQAVQIRLQTAQASGQLPPCRVEDVDPDAVLLRLAGQLLAKPGDLGV